jgi:hypothetical protein
MIDTTPRPKPDPEPDSHERSEGVVISHHVDRSPLFCDVALAERIERVEAQLIAAGSDAARHRRPMRPVSPAYPHRPTSTGSSVPSPAAAPRYRPKSPTSPIPRSVNY